MKKKTRHKKPKAPATLNIFDNPANPYFTLVNNFLALVTIVAVAIVALETVVSFSPYQFIFMVT